MEEQNLDLKKEIRLILRYIDKRLDSCTLPELKATYKMIAENMPLDGTIKDFADFCEVSETNVRVVINRKMFDKPKRAVLYPFHKFIKIVPNKWREKR